MTTFPCEIQDVKCSLQLVFGEISIKLLGLSNTSHSEIWSSGIGSWWWWHPIKSCWLHFFFLLYHWLHVVFACHTFYNFFSCCLPCHVNCSSFQTASTTYTAYLSPAFSAVKNKLKKWFHFYAFHASKLLTQFSHFVGVRMASPPPPPIQFALLLYDKFHWSQRGLQCM